MLVTCISPSESEVRASICELTARRPNQDRAHLKVLRKLETSLVVSGLIDTTDELCRQVKLKLSRVEHSGGRGKLELLPEWPIIEIMTICGHGMVAGNLVKGIVKRVKKGKKSPEEAAIDLVKLCQSGTFNPKGAERLLEKLL